MKEFMFYIRNEKDAKKSLTENEHFDFIKKCENYIAVLKSENKLVAAHPLIRDGVVISKGNNGWDERDILTDKEVPTFSKINSIQPYLLMLFSGLRKKNDFVAGSLFF